MGAGDCALGGVAGVGLGFDDETALLPGVGWLPVCLVLVAVGLVTARGVTGLVVAGRTPDADWTETAACTGCFWAAAAGNTAASACEAASAAVTMPLPAVIATASRRLVAIMLEICLFRVMYLLTRTINDRNLTLKSSLKQ